MDHKIQLFAKIINLPIKTTLHFLSSHQSIHFSNIGESKADKKTTESYTGGEKSGMAVENPDDIMGVIEKAKANSQKREENKDDYEANKPETEIRITLYQNGFTVEGGELREYEKEENKLFMKELNDGYVPAELRKKYNKKIGVALEDKRDKKYRPPTPPAYVAYSGTGQAVADI